MPRTAPLLSAFVLTLYASAAPAADPVSKLHVSQRVVVVAVGIDRYPNLLGTADLRFAETDAAEFAKLMTDRYGYAGQALLRAEGRGHQEGRSPNPQGRGGPAG